MKQPLQFMNGAFAFAFVVCPQAICGLSGVSTRHARTSSGSTTASRAARTVMVHGVLRRRPQEEPCKDLDQEVSGDPGCRRDSRPCAAAVHRRPPQRTAMRPFALLVKLGHYRGQPVSWEEFSSTTEALQHNTTLRYVGAGLLALAEQAFAYAQHQIRVLRSLHIGACFSEGAMVELAPGVAVEYVLEISHVEKLASSGYSCLASRPERGSRRS